MNKLTLQLNQIKQGRLLTNIKNWVNGYIGPLPSPNKWLFIVGCYNYGTTLLHNILASHPNIRSMPGDGQYFSNQSVFPLVLGIDRAWALKPELFYLDSASAHINAKHLNASGVQDLMTTTNPYY